jgi:ubiquitin-conjugating enzyme E2 J1
MPAWGVRTALVALRAFLETPVAGQVGGLEMSEAARRSLAEQSRGWRCAECGRSNEEILRDSEEAARKLEAEGSRKMEEKVPEELKLGYREDIVKPGPAQVDSRSELQISHSASITLTQDEDSEVAELAEGFVPTAPLPSLPQYQPQHFEPFSSYPSPQPAQSVPQATGSTPASTPTQYTSTTTTQRSIPQQRIQQQQQIQQLQRRRDRSNEGVPLWVDRTIMLLGAALIAMLLKAIFGR